MESRYPNTYVIKFYTEDSDHLPLFPILEAVGEFNSSLVCSRDRGCAFLNARSTQFIINGTKMPPVYDQALFLFKDPGTNAAKELCGFDTQNLESGLYGYSYPSPFGDKNIAGIPIFNNVLNRRGVVTADSFATSTRANGVGGAEAGIGANYYNTFQLINSTTTEIHSMFLLPDPLSGKVLLWGFQYTTYTIPVPGLAI